jgi:ABC-type multidrug transport system fused ATPase/permease subunit
MRVFWRLIGEYASLRRVWLPLLFVAMLTPPVALAMPLVEKQVIDVAILQRRLDALPRILLVYAGLWLLVTFAQTAGSFLATLSGEMLTVGLRQRLFRHFQTLSLAFSSQRHSGQTASLFLNDVPAVGALFSTTLAGALSSVVSVAVGAIFMVALSPRLAIVAGLLTPAIAIVVTLLTRPMRSAARRVQQKMAELTERLHESLTGIREIAAFGQERSQEIRFARSLSELLRLRMRLVMMDAGIQTGQSLLSLAITLAVFGYGGYLIVTGRLTLGSVIAMRLLFGQVFQPASQLFGLVVGVQKALGSADRVYGFLDETPAVPDTGTNTLPDDAEGRIEFERVSFAYEPGQQVLHNVSFVAQPGERVALVGPSGAGKSTVINLVARFYDPINGRILLDGHDLRDLPLGTAREEIGTVFQNPFLFSATIRENISFGSTGATEEQIVAAARSANAWEFIERLPCGLETEVGERGVRLSEGQKQRLAIARALLRDPSILILDEPTSALDARSEALLQEALDTASYGRTTFVIAHRLTTILRADRILVLDNGRIIEQGTHSELIRSGGLYRELFSLQFGIHGIAPVSEGIELHTVLAG